MGLDHLLAWFFPTPCAACGVPPLPLCRACALDLARSPVWIGLPGEEYRPAPRFLGLLPGRSRIALGPYQDGLASLIRVAKEGFQPRFSRILADRAASLVSPGLIRSLGLRGVCSPPSRATAGPHHPARVLAAAVAERTGLPLLSGLVRRCDLPGRTRELGARERFRHVEAVLVSGRSRCPGPGNVLVVDDLVTTGATLARMQRLLSDQGLSVTLVLSLAFTPRVNPPVRPSGIVREPRVICPGGAPRRENWSEPSAPDRAPPGSLPLDGRTSSW